MSKSSAAQARKSIAENGDATPTQTPIKVLGSYIWPEMRTICNIFDIANRAYKVDSVGDIFTEQGQKDELASNPARAMPIVVINSAKILADPCTLVKHICRHFSMEQLYPLSANMEEERQKIDQILEVCFLHFKLSSDRLVKLTIQSRAFAAGKLARWSEEQKQQLDEALAYEKNTVQTAIMQTVEQWLNETETSYLVTDKLSAADLAVYHQMKQVLAFSDLTVTQDEFPRMTEWLGWLDQSWKEGQIKGRQQFQEICERLQVSPGENED